MEALRDCWKVGVRKASGEAWVNGRAMNCDSCMGSAINRGGIVTVWLVDFAGVGLLVGKRTEIFDEAEKRRAGPGTLGGLRMYWPFQKLANYTTRCLYEADVLEFIILDC